EETLIRNLASKLPNNAVIFDVGANVGLYSAAIARHFGQSATIYAFEPSTATFSRLQNSVGHLPNVHLEKNGFGDKEEFRNLFSDKEDSALASVYQRRAFGDKYKSETIILKRVDDFCREHQIKKIDLLKVDVEGHEFSVLKGCGDFLSPEKISVIQFEFGGCNIDSRIFFRDFFELLSPYYRIYRLVADGVVELKTYRYEYEMFGSTGNFVASALPL